MTVDLFLVYFFRKTFVASCEKECVYEYVPTLPRMISETTIIIIIVYLVVTSKSVYLVVTSRVRAR